MTSRHAKTLSLEHCIDNALNAVLSKRPDLQSFIDFLSTFGNVAVFGGFVRDSIHNWVYGQEQSYRDLDLVIDGTFASSRQVSRNHFGGYRRFFSDGLKVDYWELAQTYAFRANCFSSSLNNLPLTTVYSINACAFELRTRQLYEHRAVESIQQRIIRFNCKQYLNLFPLYQAFRGIDFASRLGYSLDPDVESFIGSTFRTSTCSEFVNAVQQHRSDVPAEELERLYYMFGESVKAV